MIRAKNLAFKFTALLCLFLYLFPFQFKVLPLSNTRILQIIGAIGLLIYILYKKKIHTKILTFNYYGIIILIIGIFSTIIVNESNQFNFALTKGLYIVLYSCSAFLIVSLLKKSNKNFTPIKALEAIIYVTIFQAIISLLFFCFPNILELYNSLIIIDDNYLQKTEELNSFRLVGIGSVQFANAAVHYGIALWILILSYISKDSYFYNKSWALYIISPLFCICGILSARTFFVILILTIIYIYYLLGYSHVKKAINIILKISIPLILIGIGILAYMIANDLDFIIEWALELFINMSDGGKLESASTNELKDMYVWPSSLKTWVCGDGMSQNASGGFYMDSDVGYIRSLYYWGIIGSIIYYSIQFKYVSILRKSFHDYKIIQLINIILIWFFIYSLKEFWAVEPYWVLLLFIALFSNQSKKHTT